MKVFNNFKFNITAKLNKGFLSNIFKHDFSSFSRNNIINSNSIGYLIKEKPVINPFFFIQKFFLRSLIKKRNDYNNKNKGYKMKNRNSLRKRLKIVGPAYDRHYMFRRIGFYHKRTKKTARNRSKPKLKLVAISNRRFIKRNLPLFKTKKTKVQRYC